MQEDEPMASHNRLISYIVRRKLIRRLFIVVLARQNPKNYLCERLYKQFSTPLTSNNHFQLSKSLFFS